MPTLYYPRPAYNARLTGTVKIGFDVTALGETENVHVVEASLPGAFDQAALTYVRGWLFESSVAVPSQGQTTVVSFDLKNAVLKPVHAVVARPVYPPDAEAAAIMGFCNISYWIEPDGSVSDVRIMQCFPSGVFDQASLNAVRLFSFRPEADAALNRRRQDHIHIAFRIEGTNEKDLHYLKPGQWIRLRYTLTLRGRATDIEVVGKSSSDLSTRNAIEQLRETTLQPMLVDGVPVAAPGQIITIVGK